MSVSATPHTGLGGPARAAWTRCSGPSQDAQGGGCCPRRYTGASAFESRTPGLHTHIYFGFFLIRFNEFRTEKRPTPVVKHSCGLDRVKDGTAVAGWEGGREVEAGEDWVRIRGWWGQIRAGTLGWSLCGSEIRAELLPNDSIIMSYQLNRT